VYPSHLIQGLGYTIIMFTVDHHADRLQRETEFFNLQHILQPHVGTKTISVNSEKWKLFSNISDFSSKMPIM